MNKEILKNFNGLKIVKFNNYLMPLNAKNSLSDFNKDIAFIESVKKNKLIKDYEKNFLINSIAEHFIHLNKNKLSDQYIVNKGDIFKYFNDKKNALNYALDIMPYCYFSPITFELKEFNKEQIKNNNLKVIK